MTAAALGVAVLTVLPLLIVGERAFNTGWGAAVDYLVRPRIGELLANTALLVLVTVPASVVIGVGAAWLVERTNLPFAGLWRLLLLAPLAVPAFVSSYAWLSIFPWLDGLAGASLVTTMAYYPFVFLPVAALLRALDPSNEDVARSLGCTQWEAVRRTVLPRLRPAISGGALLVGLHLLAEYGVLELMRYPTLTTAILQQYAVGFNDDSGSLLALVLVLACLTFLGLEVLLRGSARVARVGSGAQGALRRTPLHRWRVPSLAGLAAVVTLALLVPVALVARWVWLAP